MTARNGLSHVSIQPESIANKLPNSSLPPFANNFFETRDT